LLKRLFRVAFIAAFLVPAAFLIAREGNNALNGDEIPEHVAEVLPEPIRWYRSNTAGMALEYIPSRLVAIRNEYSLSVEIVSPEKLPEILAPYHDTSHRIELRTLFKHGEESRHQWIFRDSRNIAMLVASGSFCFFGGESSEDEERSGFIEFKNEDGSVVRERLFESDLSQWEFRFFFEGSLLLSSETWFKEAPAPIPVPLPEYSYEISYAYAAVEEEIEVVYTTPSFVLLFTDFYRYSRSGALRAIDRIVHGLEEDALDEIDRVLFPRIDPVIYPGVYLERESGTVAVFYIPAFILSAINIEDARVSYTVDSRGRVLNEVWKDDDGRILGEFLNTWSGDRIMSVLWRTDNDERLVEYKYDDDGNRISERNYRKGVLERSVTVRDGKDIEDIFMNGRLMLRAVWEDGLKISEERISHIGTGGN